MKKIIAYVLIAIVSFALFSTAVTYACDTCGCQVEAAAKSACAEKVWWNPLSWFKTSKTPCQMTK